MLSHKSKGDSQTGKTASMRHFHQRIIASSHSNWNRKKSHFRIHNCLSSPHAHQHISTFLMQLLTATENDIHAIREVVEEVWPIAYREVISSEQIDYMLDMMYSKDALLKQLDEGCEFILAKEENTLVGFAGYQDMGAGIFKLHKLYVLSTQQGKGTGKMLLDEVCRRSNVKGGKSIELQVNKKNNAKYFYEKNGFHIDHEDVFDIGNGFVMDDFIMKKTLC